MATTGESAARAKDAGVAVRKRCREARRAFEALERRVEALRRMEASKLAGPDAWRYTDDEPLFERLAALEDIGELMEDLDRALGEATAQCNTLVGSRRTMVMRDDGAYMRDMGGPYAGEEPWSASADLACPACGAMLLVGPVEGELYCVRCGRTVSEPMEVPMYGRTKESVWDFEKN